MSLTSVKRHIPTPHIDMYVVPTSHCLRTSILSRHAFYTCRQGRRVMHHCCKLESHDVTMARVLTREGALLYGVVKQARIPDLAASGLGMLGNTACIRGLMAG